MSPILTDGTYLVTSGGFLTESSSQTEDPNLAALLHFDSSVTLDETGRVWSVGAGTPVISSAESYFGGNSMYLDGSSKINTAIDPSITLSDGSAWTVDFWAKRTVTSGVGRVALAHDSAAWTGFMIGFVESGQERVYLTGSPGQWSILNSYNIGAPTLNWRHYAVGFDGVNQYYVWSDGVLKTTVTNAATIKAPLTTGIQIGQYDTTTGFAGYIDEVRVSKTLRWTTSFTPPTSPYTIYL